MQRLFQVGQIVEIRILHEDFNPEDYYIVTIVAIHGSADEIRYYTSNPKDAEPCDKTWRNADIELNFTQGNQLRLMSGENISVNVL